MSQISSPQNKNQEKKKLHELDYPVLKLSTDGHILYANKAAFPLLKALNSSVSRTLSSGILKSYPELINPRANTNLLIKTESGDFAISVIGFPEAGYIGVYGGTTIHHS